MSELVGAAVKFAIGQLLVFENQGYGVRGFLDLSLKQFVDALVSSDNRSSYRSTPPKVGAFRPRSVRAIR